MKVRWHYQDVIDLFGYLVVWSDSIDIRVEWFEKRANINVIGVLNERSWSQ
jgi:hypothetical protein